MTEQAYKLVFTDNKGQKRFIEFSRFNLDEEYHRFVRYVAAYLVDNEYDVTSSTDIKDQAQRGRRQFYELFFRSKTRAGFFRKKTEFGKMHSFWIGYSKDKAILNEIMFKIDDRQVPPVSVLKVIHYIVEHQK